MQNEVNQKNNGKTTYNYNPPRAGTLHKLPVGYPTPEGTSVVAFAYTYPNLYEFSATDENNAKNLGIDAYVVGPSLELKRYNLLSDTTAGLGTISPVPLTDAQRASLVAEFQVSWDAHTACGCKFYCKYLTWPTP